MASKNVGSERKREPICAAKAHGTSQLAGGRIELDSTVVGLSTDLAPLIISKILDLGFHGLNRSSWS